jgi:hypothetical protein
VRELNQRMDDLEQKFKVLEREHEDLHASYRRLRGARAVEARDAPREPVRARPGEPGADPQRPFTKEEMRRKYLVVGTRKLGGNNELFDETS